jgi:hypothetical protein
MANPEHLKILKKGVEAWNKWRKENPHIKPNLSEMDLRKMNLRKAGLRKVNLSEVDLSGANLSWAILIEANLRGANLSKVNLYEANLLMADLLLADLREANLVGADLMRADLYATNIKGANLKNTNLHLCNLVRSNLSEVVLTGAKLYGTSRDDWIIKNIECEYVYWDKDGKQRSPRDRNLKPGEFEKLYAVLPFFEYVFENGMSPIDPLIMDRVVEAIREKHPEWDIKIDSINARGLAPSIKFTVQHEEHREPALSEVSKEYQIKHAQLEGKIEEIDRHIRNLIDRPNTINIINAPQAKYLAIDGSTLNVQEASNHYAFELHKAIEQEPEESRSFTRVAKKTALDIIGGAMKDIAKGQVKKAAKRIIKLGKDLGPLFLKMAPTAYTFFKSMLQ